MARPAGDRVEKGHPGRGKHAGGGAERERRVGPAGMGQTRVCERSWIARSGTVACAEWGGCGHRAVSSWDCGSLSSGGFLSICLKGHLLS